MEPNRTEHEHGDAGGDCRRCGRPLTWNVGPQYSGWVVRDVEGSARNVCTISDGLAIGHAPNRTEPNGGTCRYCGARILYLHSIPGPARWAHVDASEGADCANARGDLETEPETDPRANVRTEPNRTEPMPGPDRGARILGMMNGGVGRG